MEIESVRLLQTRLDRIKKRHDELEPRGSSSEGEADLPTTPLMTPTEGTFPRSRSTITMVAESPQTGSMNKAERLMGLGFGQVDRNGGEIDGDKGSVGKGMSWFKKSFGNKKRKGGSTPDPSPSLGSSPLLGAGTSPRLTPILGKSPRLPEQTKTSLDSPGASLKSGGSDSPTFSTHQSTSRKAKPPTILTTSPQEPAPPISPTSFSFTFELPTASPRSDTFDPTPAPAPSSPGATMGVQAQRQRTSQPPSPGQPPSPQMSRSFSKRSSLLPPPTARELEKEVMMGDEQRSGEENERVKKKEREREKERKEREDGEGYDKKLHAYAIRMLAELEDAQKEVSTPTSCSLGVGMSASRIILTKRWQYDEWWSDGGVGRMDGAPPRLTVAWPFHEGED